MSEEKKEMTMSKDDYEKAIAFFTAPGAQLDDAIVRKAYLQGLSSDPTNEEIVDHYFQGEMEKFQQRPDFTFEDICKDDFKLLKFFANDIVKTINAVMEIQRKSTKEKTKYSLYKTIPYVLLVKLVLALPDLPAKYYEFDFKKADEKARGKGALVFPVYDDQRRRLPLYKLVDTDDYCLLDDLFGSCFQGQNEEDADNAKKYFVGKMSQPKYSSGKYSLKQTEFLANYPNGVYDERRGEFCSIDDPDFVERYGDVVFLSYSSVYEWNPNATTSPVFHMVLQDEDEKEYVKDITVDDLFEMWEGKDRWGKLQQKWIYYKYRYIQAHHVAGKGDDSILANDGLSQDTKGGNGKSCLLDLFHASVIGDGSVEAPTMSGLANVLDKSIVAIGGFGDSADYDAAFLNVHDEDNVLIDDKENWKRIHRKGNISIEPKRINKMSMSIAYLNLLRAMNGAVQYPYTADLIALKFGVHYIRMNEQIRNTTNEDTSAAFQAWLTSREVHQYILQRSYEIVGSKLPDDYPKEIHEMFTHNAQEIEQNSRGYERTIIEILEHIPVLDAMQLYTVFNRISNVEGTTRGKVRSIDDVMMVAKTAAELRPDLIKIVRGKHHGSFGKKDQQKIGLENEYNKELSEWLSLYYPNHESYNDGLLIDTATGVDNNKYDIVLFDNLVYGTRPKSSKFNQAEPLSNFHLYEDGYKGYYAKNWLIVRSDYVSKNVEQYEQLLVKRAANSVDAEEDERARA